MNTENTREQKIKIIFAHYPNAESIFLTSDDAAFFSESDAKNHAKDLENKKVSKYSASESEAVADEQPASSNEPVGAAGEPAKKETKVDVEAAAGEPAKTGTKVDDEAAAGEPAKTKTKADVEAAAGEPAKTEAKAQESTAPKAKSKSASPSGIEGTKK